MIDQLLRRIEALEREVRTLKDTRTIARDQETALKHRLGVLTADGQIGTFTQSGLERTISLSGNAQSITVLEYPTQYIPIKIRGAQKKIPIFNDA